MTDDEVTQEIIDGFFAEYDRRIVSSPDPEYAARLQAYEPRLRELAAADPDGFAQEVMRLLNEMLGEQDEDAELQLPGGQMTDKGPRRQGVKLPATATEREAAQTIHDMLITGAQRVGERFTRPDDDWDPVWAVNDGKGHGTLLTPSRMEGPRDKVRMTAAVAAYARKVGAVAIGHLNSSWLVIAEGISEARMREIHAQMDANHGSTDGIPERREGLMVAVYTAGSYRHHLAFIQRDGEHPPTLGPFELFGDSGRDGFTAEGRMMDPLQESLRRLG